jgi:hypothetical protein
MLLSLLVSVQALPASCDIRCTSMGAMTGHASSHADGQMPHCHALPTKSGKKTTLTATDSCATTPCATDLKAIKNAGRSDSDSSKLLLSAIALPIDPFQSVAPRSTSSLAFAGRSDGRPLAQRPGSSLRI